MEVNWFLIRRTIDWFYLGGVLQDGQQALLDTSDQFQSGVEMFWFQQPDTRGQVSALQQSLL